MQNRYRYALLPLLLWGGAAPASALDLGASPLSETSLRCPGPAVIRLVPGLPDPVARSVSLTLIDEETHSPLSGGEVRLVAEEGSWLVPEGLSEEGQEILLTSDEEGRVRFRVHPEGAEGAWSEGFFSATVEVFWQKKPWQEESCEITTQWVGGEEDPSPVPIETARL